MAALVAGVTLPVMCLVVPVSVRAQNATWVGGAPGPADSNYFTSTNWAPITVPTGTATFGASANTNISIPEAPPIGGWTFSPGASAYTFTIDFLAQIDFTGAGITINGGSASITNNALLQFNNSSTAGSASITNNFSLWFFDSSTAGSANITTTHAVEFFNNSSAGNAAITSVGAIAAINFANTSGPNNDNKVSAGSIAGSGTFTLGQNELTVGSNDLSTTVSGVIVDGIFAGGSLVKVGGGTLTLSGANTYSGGTTLTSGALNVGVDSVFTAPGDPTTPIVSSAIGTGTLKFNGGTLQAGGNFTIANATQVYSTGGTIDSNGSTFTHAGNISDAIGQVGNLTIKDSTASTGVVVLSGNNTYSSATIVDSGTLKAGSATGLSSNSAFSVNAGATLDVNGFHSSIGSLADGTGGGGTVTNNGAANATLTTGVDNRTTAFSGIIQDGSTHTLALNMTGTGTLTLSGANTYSGGTTLDIGSVKVGVDSVFNTPGDPTSGIVSSAIGTGTLTFKGGALQAGGNFTIGNAAQIGSPGGVIDANGHTFIYAGTISDAPGNTGGLRITDFFGTGAVVLTGNNTYSGGTALAGAVLNVGVDSVFNTPGDPTSGIVSSAIGTGTINFNGGTLQAGGSFTIANAATLGANPATIDANGYAFTYAGNISDNGFTPTRLNIIDSSGAFGTVILSGTNTYSSGTLVTNATVQVNNSSAVGTGAVTLENALFQAGAADLVFSNNFKINSTPGGSAIDANGYALTIAGNIADGNGPGKLTVLDSFGGGTVILTGTNTYTGGTTICGCAMLQLGDATHTASIVGAVTNFGIFDIVNANTAGITSIDNNGGLTAFYNATSAGTMTITNRNGGETDFGIPLGTDTATAGNAVIINRSGGLTVFNAATSAGSASITNRFSGETDFWDQSNAGNATIVNRFNGVTTFNNSSSADNAGITNRFGGSTFFFDQSSAGNATITNGSSGNFFGFFPPVGLGFFDDSTAGTATIINNNHGFIAFGVPFSFDTASADHANITNNAGSSLEFNGLTTAGNATITTLSGGAVAFFDGSTGGNAKFITNGTGWVDFSGSIGPGFDGRITAGSIAGSGTYYIGAGNTLITGSNNLSTEVSGVIADFNPSPPCGCPTFPGPGSLEKVGAGTMILSGTNSYSGTTTVNGGILEVDGSIVSSSLTTVNANAALTGTGTVGNTVIAGGGIFQPGNGTPGSSMTVAGNLAFQSGALYLVQLNPAASTLASVTGTASLNGGTGAAFLNGNYVAKQYTILTATGGVSGIFTSFDTLNIPAGFKASLSYDAHDVYLDLAIGFFAPGGLNQNQQNVSNALSKFFNATGSIPIVFGTMTPAGLSQVSGETATGTQQATFQAMNLFLGLLTDPFIDGRGASASPAGGATPFAEEGDSASAYAARKQNAAQGAFAKIPTKAEAARNDLLDPRWSVWGSAYGGGATTDGNAALGSNSSTARAFGFVAGADYRISPATLAGFALAGGGTNFSVNGFGTGRSDLFQAGAFVRHNVGAAYLSGALAYGWQDVTTDRTVTIAGIDRLHAEFNANAYSGRIEGGYRFATRWMGITPYAAGQFTTYSLPAYAEQVLSGAGTFALNYAAKDVTASRTELGIRTDRSFALQNAILTLRGRFAWAHDFDSDRNISAVFQTLPGASFVVNGAAQAHDAALTTASAEMKWLNGFSLAATFEGEFSGVTNSYAGKAVARYTW